MSGLNVGGVDLVHEIIDLRYQLIRMQLILDEILSNQDNKITPLSDANIKKIEDSVITQLIRKYPNSVSRK
jgi:hypothetical protein